MRALTTALALCLAAAAGPLAAEEPAPEGGRAGGEGPVLDVASLFPAPTAREKERMEALCGRLRHPYWQVRRRAERALAAMGDVVIPFLEKTLGREPSAEVRLRLRLALRRLHWIPASDLRSVVRRSIASLRREKNLDALERVKKAIVHQGLRLLPLLRLYLGDGDWQIRKDMVLLLRAVGERHREKAVVPLLLEALDDSAPGVREEAAWALQAFTGKPWKCYHRDRWRAWWKREGAAFAMPEEEDGR